MDKQLFFLYCLLYVVFCSAALVVTWALFQYLGSL